MMALKPLKVILLIAGTICLGLGILGIFLPLLPTTPFLILAALCYVRSSEKMYKWLLNNKLCGEYLRNYLERKGMRVRNKIITLALLWATLGVSAFLFTDILEIRLLLLVVGVGVTCHILWIKTYRK